LDQLGLVRDSEVRQKAVEVAAASAAGAKGKPASNAKPAAKGDKGKKQESAAATGAGQVQSNLPQPSLEVVLTSLSQMSDVVTRYVQLAHNNCNALAGEALMPAAGTRGASGRTPDARLNPDVIGSVVASLSGILQLPMPWEYRQVISRAVSQCLGVIAEANEEYRIIVRDAMVMPCLLEILNVNGKQSNHWRL